MAQSIPPTYLDWGGAGRFWRRNHCTGNNCVSSVVRNRGHSHASDQSKPDMHTANITVHLFIPLILCTYTRPILKFAVLRRCVGMAFTCSLAYIALNHFGCPTLANMLIGCKLIHTFSVLPLQRTEETTATQRISHRPIKCLLPSVVTSRHEGQRDTSW